MDLHAHADVYIFYVLYINIFTFMYKSVFLYKVLTNLFLGYYRGFLVIVSEYMYSELFSDVILRKCLKSGFPTPLSLLNAKLNGIMAMKMKIQYWCMVVYILHV